MATRIRLRRVGRKHQPSYRIVVTDKMSPRDGRFIESLGHYNPRTEPITLEVNANKALEWLSKGATPSDTVRSLFKKAGVFSGATASEAAAPASEATAPVGETAPAEPEATPEAPVEAPGEPGAAEE